MFLQDKMDVFNRPAAKFYYIIFNLIAITIGVYIGVDIFYRVIGMKYSQTEVGKVSAPVTVKEGAATVKTGLNSYQTIIDRHIFSRIDVSSQNDAGADESKNTSLKLTLIGTIAGDSKNSAAIIEDGATKTQGLYRVGDNIQGAVIKSIARKKVVLKVGTREEVLAMEESETSAKRAGYNAVQVENIAESVSSAPAAVERSITIQRKDIETALNDVNELLSQASVQPHSTDGEPDGLTITGIKAGSIFRKMGLRNGDILKGVNNDSIRTTEDLINMYNDLKSAPDISLQILRRGQDRTINYSFSD